jgi:hypothetical protein
MWLLVESKLLALQLLMLFGLLVAAETSLTSIQATMSAQT